MRIPERVNNPKINKIASIVVGIAGIASIGIFMVNFVLPYADPSVQNAIEYNKISSDILQTCDGLFVKECQQTRTEIRETCFDETFEGYEKYLTHCNDKRLNPDIPLDIMPSIQILNANAHLSLSSCPTVSNDSPPDCLFLAQELRGMCNENPEFRDRRIFTFCDSV